MNDDIARAGEIIREADAVLITAGAGMGVDSGLPDFRGKEGFWKAYPPIKNLGLSFSDMASPHWFETDPQFAWAFYGHRLHLYRDTTPHEGFGVLLDMETGKRVIISSIPPMSMDSSRKPGSTKRRLWRSMVRSTICSVPEAAGDVSGRPRAST